MKYFITSDIHSYFNELTAALQHQGFEKDNPDHILVCVGDLFDRGPGSLELYDYCRLLGDHRFVYIRGNHENLLLDLLKEIEAGFTPSYHHLTNGTIRTVEDLTGIPLYLWEANPGAVLTRMQPIKEWILGKTVNHFDIGDMVLTHGWVPPTLIQDESSWDLPENQPLWDDAMWLNGMEQWQRGLTILGKAIVCGHWHTSYIRYHQGQIDREFPPKGDREAIRKAFSPWMAPGIIALDSCVAYSGFLNVIVIEQP